MKNQGSRTLTPGLWDDCEKKTRKTSFTVPAGKTATQTLYIEGVKHSDAKKDVKIKAKLTAPAITVDNVKYKACDKETEEKETTVYQADLDIDSLNDSGFQATYTDSEDKIELSNKAINLGKICIANNQRHPQTERVLGWADGFNAATPPQDDTLTGVQFVPVRVKLEKPSNPASATIRFTYSASDPSAVATQTGPGGQPLDYTLPDGLGRLWKKDASIQRNKQSVVAGGDYVPAEEIQWSKIAAGDAATLYFECVRGSTTKQTLRIEVTDDSVVCKDGVNFSIESIDIAQHGYFNLLSDNVFNYIPTGERAVNESQNRIRISSDVKYMGPQTLTASISSTATTQDVFQPNSGSGDFQSLLKSRGTGAEQSAARTITAERAQMEHKMRPALYRNQFHITAYSTSNETDFTGAAVNNDAYYVRGLNHYYFINSAVAARSAFLRNVSIEGYGITLNSTVLQATPTARAAPNPRPAGTNTRTQFFNVNMAAVPAPLGIASRPLIDGQSCAITRHGNTTRGQVIPDNSTILVIDAANVTYTNRANAIQTLNATRSCVDRVTDGLGAWHIDMYVNATRTERDGINFQSQVILHSQ